MWHVSRPSMSRPLSRCTRASGSFDDYRNDGIDVLTLHYDTVNTHRCFGGSGATGTVPTKETGEDPGIESVGFPTWDLGGSSVVYSG